MATSSTSDAIPTAEAEPITTTGWKWVLGCLLSLPAAFVLLGLVRVLFGEGSDLIGIAAVPILLGLPLWVFGLRNDVNAVWKADVDWNPRFLRYFAAGWLLTPYVSAVIYTLQRYRKVGLRSTLPP